MSLQSGSERLFKRVVLRVSECLDKESVQSGSEEECLPIGP